MINKTEIPTAIPITIPVLDYPEPPSLPATSTDEERIG
jgi:hypothetical protein